MATHDSKRAHTPNDFRSFLFLRIVHCEQNRGNAHKGIVQMEFARNAKHYTCACLSAREPPNSTPVHVRALSSNQTLHLCRFLRPRTTKHYTCTSLSVREPPNITPVQIRALTKHQRLHLCKFERSRATRHYNSAGSSAHGTLNITPVHV